MKSEMFMEKGKEQSGVNVSVILIRQIKKKYTLELFKVYKEYLGDFVKFLPFNIEKDEITGKEIKEVTEAQREGLHAIQNIIDAMCIILNTVDGEVVYIQNNGINRRGSRVEADTLEEVVYSYGISQGIVGEKLSDKEEGSIRKSRIFRGGVVKSLGNDNILIINEHKAKVVSRFELEKSKKAIINIITSIKTIDIVKITKDGEILVSETDNNGFKFLVNKESIKDIVTELWSAEC